MLLPWMMPKDVKVLALLDKLPDAARALCLSARWGATRQVDVKEFTYWWWNRHNPQARHKDGVVKGRWESWKWHGVVSPWYRYGAGGCERVYGADLPRVELSGWVRTTWEDSWSALRNVPNLSARDRRLLEEGARKQDALRADRFCMGPRHVLGVGAGATSDEIKLAYRRLASVCHPDRGGDVGRMQEINAAYRALAG